jgi:hypothetical protein
MLAKHNPQSTKSEAQQSPMLYFTFDEFTKGLKVSLPILL